jgi:3-phenylpropionate/cinnamic acid dioxygenase small subunit
MSEEREEVAELVYRYARLLDERRFAEWLELFSGETFYGVIPYRNYARGELLFLVKENKRQLQSRVDAYRDEEPIKTLHMLTNVTADLLDVDRAKTRAYFALYEEGRLALVGTYEQELEKKDGDWRIGRCLVILDTTPIRGSIQVPI